jgi:hypothetical protein
MIELSNLEEDEMDMVELADDTMKRCFRSGEKVERDRIRRELWAWLVGDVEPRDAGLYNHRRIVDEIKRICPEEE